MRPMIGSARLLRLSKGRPTSPACSYWWHGPTRGGSQFRLTQTKTAFESLISLPSEQQETRLGELAKQLDEDVAVIRDHFTAFVGMQSWTASTNSWNVELWPDPVETQALLQKISAKIRT